MKYFSFIFMFLIATPSFAYGPGECDYLWKSRNTIYQEAGYCFKQERAISFFGNGGCKYDDVKDVPLSLYQRNQIDQIVSEERRVGCK